MNPKRSEFRLKAITEAKELKEARTYVNTGENIVLY